MLTAPAPFPQIGAYALFYDDGDRKTHLVRIQRRHGPDAVISFPLRAGASGTRTVPLADLLDGTPLTGSERAEWRRLEAELRGMVRPGKARIDRAAELRLREIRSMKLADLMRDLPDTRAVA